MNPSNISNRTPHLMMTGDKNMLISTLTTHPQSFATRLLPAPQIHPNPRLPTLTSSHSFIPIKAFLGSQVRFQRPYMIPNQPFGA
jgi:hypothetical protein